MAIELKAKYTRNEDGEHQLLGNVSCTLQPVQSNGRLDVGLGKEAFQRLTLPYGVSWFGYAEPPAPFTIYGRQGSLTIEAGLKLQDQLTAEIDRLFHLEQDIKAIQSARKV